MPALIIIAIRSRYMSELPVWAANQGDLKGAAAIPRSGWNINTQVADDATTTPTQPSRRTS